jgi:hypothetical protein
MCIKGQMQGYIMKIYIQDISGYEFVRCKGYWKGDRLTVHFVLYFLSAC